MSSVRSAMCWQPARAIPVEVLLDLALLLAGRRLVDRELDPAVAVGHDLRHQRAVLGVDDLVVVVDELGEAEHVAVEVDELVHLAEPDVADAVVDLEQADSPSAARRRLLDLAVARARRRRGSRAGRRTSGGPRRRCGSRAVRRTPSSPPSSSVGLEGRDARRATSSRARPTRRRRPRTRCRGRRRRARGRARRSRRPG